MRISGFRKRQYPRTDYSNCPEVDWSASRPLAHFLARAIRGGDDRRCPEFNKRGALTGEALEVLRLAWGGGAVAKQGRNFNAAGNEPRPAPNPQPTVWIGGSSAKAKELAALWGDSRSPFFSRPTRTKAPQETGIRDVAQLGEKIRVLHECGARLGKTGPFDVAIDPRRTSANTRDEADRFPETLGEPAVVGVN